MDYCNRCKGPAIPLFTGFACKNECDLPESEAKREARLAYKVTYEAMQKISVPLITVPVNRPLAPCPFVIGEIVWNRVTPPRRRTCGEVRSIDHSNRSFRISWLDDGSDSGELGWANFSQCPVPMNQLPP